MNIHNFSLKSLLQFSIFIMLIVFAIPGCKTCEGKILKPGKYAEGFVAAPASSINHTGVIRLSTGTDDHGSPSCLYYYKQNNQLQRYDKVYVELKRINNLIVANEIKKQVGTDNILPVSFARDEIKKECLNLHQLFEHPENPAHRYGHIVQSTFDPSITFLNGGQTYALADYEPNGGGTIEKMLVPFTPIDTFGNYFYLFDGVEIIQNVTYNYVVDISPTHSHIGDPK